MQNLPASEPLAAWRRAAWIGGLIVLAVAGCQRSTAPSVAATATLKPDVPHRKFNFTPSPSTPPASPPPAAALQFPRFSEVASERGIHHVYDNGASPKALMVESTGGGCAWFDFDLDGRLDLFLTQGGRPDIGPGDSRPPDACYRQLDGHRFVEVSAVVGLADAGYGQGVAVGDFDNDGFDDVFVCNVGRSSFYLNCGDGTFRSANDVLEGKRHVWSACAAWGDVDRDGDLDLYVCNYAKYDPYHPIECRDKEGIPSICHPRNVEPEPDEFFLNTGDGRLVEVSQAWGLFGPGNKALGVVIADLTGDEWPEIYVANDTTANFLFVNEGGRSFKESALVLGGAFSATGEPQASMGVAFGDYDQNGLPDLCLSHFTGEHNTLYQNLGPLGLQDVSAMTGLREPSLPKLGFGIVMCDFNFDGHMDLFVTNGHIDPRFDESEGYEMAPQIFSFDGRRWQEGSAVAGECFQRRAVGRGVATADYDRDGDVDLFVVHQNSPAALLQNDSDRQHGLQIALVGGHSNRSGFGARATVRYGDRRLVSELAGGSSYAAAHERVLSFGLADWNGPVHVEVVWPSGAIDEFQLTHPDQAVVVGEERGILPEHRAGD